MARERIFLAHQKQHAQFIYEKAASIRLTHWLAPTHGNWRGLFWQVDKGNRNSDP
jgi:hypothetical protein